MMIDIILYLAGALSFYLCFKDWKTGIFLYILVSPISGAVSLLLQPLILPLIFKDLFILIPSYIGFFYKLIQYREKIEILPKNLNLIFLFLIILVLIQCFNLNTNNLMMSLIGLKVWIFYLPVAYMSFLLGRNNNYLIKILRVIVSVAVIPTIVGLFQWILTEIIGYEEALTLFYGDAASASSQGFTRFVHSDVGAFYRIPSTFTYVGQYFGFLLTMLVPSYILMNIDQSKKWRNFSFFIFVITIFAAFMCGSRAAYIFVPGLIFTMIFLHRGIINSPKYIVLALLLIPFFILFLDLIGISFFILFEMLSDLITNYSQSIVIDGLVSSFKNIYFGLGTGSNTGAARYALENPELFLAVENYYAKSIIELGVLGFVIVLLIFVSPTIYFYYYKKYIKNKDLFIVATSTLSFIIIMMINSAKGWQIDMDPVNFYFWLFYGLFFSTLNTRRT